jgi:hypothetical protein
VKDKIMAKPKKDQQPIELAGVNVGGISVGGDRIIFGFESLKGRAWTFSAPHEAAGEILQKILYVAEMAHKARGSPTKFGSPEGAIERLRSQTLTDFQVRGSAEGLVLVLLCGPLQFQMALSPEQSTKIGEALIESRSLWEARKRPH